MRYCHNVQSTQIQTLTSPHILAIPLTPALLLSSRFSAVFMWLKAANAQPTKFGSHALINLACPVLSTTFTSGGQIKAELTPVFILLSLPLPSFMSHNRRFLKVGCSRRESFAIHLLCSLHQNSIPHSFISLAQFQAAFMLLSYVPCHMG